MPWEKQFDENQVLEKAMQAFWARGYEATSMQDLVECTGINRGSLYSVYRDKRELFLAALRLYADEVFHKRLAYLEANLAPGEAIRQAFLPFVAQVSDGSKNRGCFLTNTALELAAHDAEVGKVVAAAQKNTEGFFARVIKKGKSQGEFASHLKPTEAASSLLASLIGLSVLCRSRPEGSLLQGIVDDALHRLH